MLTHIQIRDFAIVDQVELELGAGLTVLTGETGAGKSILVDALLLAAGGRSGAEVVRHGSERAEVSATFVVAGNAAALACLSERSIEHEGECVLRRVVGRDGRSRAYVNGQAMPVQVLRQLGEVLLEVHGQMEYQSLMRRAAQRELLDRNGTHAVIAGRVEQLWRELAELRGERERASASAQDRAARLELLHYHLKELAALELKAGEFDELAAERLRLSQHGRLAEGVRQILQLLREADDMSAEYAISRALGVARSLAELDARFAPINRTLDESLIALRDGVGAVQRYEASLEADPTRQEWVEQRLAALESVARKHRIEPGGLLALQAQLAGELERLASVEASLGTLETRVAEVEARFRAACAELSSARQQIARHLSERVTALMQTLGMPGGSFEIRVQPAAADAAGPHGADDIEFLVSANPGQPPRPLAKVASGGELSRISLAIQVAAAQAERSGERVGDAGAAESDTTLPCLVFDEVDAGVGGGVAEIVGRQLRTLGGQAQVLCVTHLPQVASQAHAHVKVTKLTDGKSTRTSLHSLVGAERIEEIARMLGGIDITAKAREHAAEMLRTDAAATPKKRKGGRS